ncbi:hypothetical protein Cgig2_003770 [Carnegiea gigantea]|uniref:Uncharacterized protein n=1 Tax=Carnegiea gigantea TaxID=171969 RepID=A0A9Q1GJG9_9CARY|nr:hypothetical protein Cgig2_003770 [Carnegiea gigantea]
MTPSTYGGARHANKPGHCAITSSTYDGTNLGIVRRCPVPMVVRTWVMCDIVQCLWWYKLGHCATMSSTYDGTNNASRTLGMNRDKELPQLGITSAGCRGSWTYRGLPAGQPLELGRRISLGSRGRAGRRDMPFGHGGYMVAVGKGDYSLAVGVLRDTLVHHDSSRKTRQRKEKLGSGFS